MSISERASALVQQVKRDPGDLDRLREEWRLKAETYSAAKDRAKRMEEGRKLLLDEMALRLKIGGMAMDRARMEARTSKEFRAYLEEMHVAAREAQDAWIAQEVADRVYWELKGRNADDRAEKRMTR